MKKYPSVMCVIRRAYRGFRIDAIYLLGGTITGAITAHMASDHLAYYYLPPVQQQLSLFLSFALGGLIGLRLVHHMRDRSLDVVKVEVKGNE